jgi:hypothetical protein
MANTTDIDDRTDSWIHNGSCQNCTWDMEETFELLNSSARCCGVRLLVLTKVTIYPPWVVGATTVF